MAEVDGAPTPVCTVPIESRAAMDFATCLPGFKQDPYPTYAAWRDSAPLHWTQEFLDGAWLVTRHADVDAVLRDPRFSAQRTGGWPQAGGVEGSRSRRFRQLFSRALLFLDDPDHGRVRKALRTAFNPAAMRSLADFVDRTTHELVDTLAAPKPVDFMAAVARPLPARVIAHWMGLDECDPQHFMRWSETLASFIGALQPTPMQVLAAQDSLVSMATALEDVLAARRAAPANDLVSALILAEAKGELLAGPELVAQCAMLLFAGYETSRNLLGNGMHALAGHPAQWERLRQDPALLPGAVRELLRFDSPVQYTARRVSTDMKWHGQWLRRGDAVVVLIGSGNRDPRVFDRPDELDLGRVGAASLSFGAGAHACIGAALTQIEAQAVLRLLSQRCTEVTLVDEVANWNRNPVYRGLTRLPLKCTFASTATGRIE